MHHILWATMISILMTGCASLNEAECESADWHLIGYEDGVRGYDADRIGAHRKSCSEYDISPDLDSYLAGREDGLQRYCTVANGFNLAKSGRIYGGVCPDDIEQDFLDGYSIGEEVHELTSRVKSTEDEITHSSKALADIAIEINDKEAVLVSSDTGVQDRLDALESMRQLEKKQKVMQQEHEQMIDDVSSMKQEIKKLENAVR